MAIVLGLALGVLPPMVMVAIIAPIIALMIVLADARENVQGHVPHLVLEIVLVPVIVFAHHAGVVVKML